MLTTHSVGSTKAPLIQMPTLECLTFQRTPYQRFILEDRHFGVRQIYNQSLSQRALTLRVAQHLKDPVFKP